MGEKPLPGGPASFRALIPEAARWATRKSTKKGRGANAAALEPKVGS